MDLTHWDTLEKDFTFDQVASLACDWDPYQDIQCLPSAIAAKRAFLMDRMREAYQSTFRWCAFTFVRCHENKEFDDEGFLRLPYLPYTYEWDDEVTPWLTSDIESLWDNAKSVKDFDLLGSLTRLPPVEQQEIWRLPVCAFLASVGWKSGYDFASQMGAYVTREPDGAYRYKSTEEFEAARAIRDDLGSTTTAEPGQINGSVELPPNEMRMHGKTQRHYLKVIAGLLNIQKISKSETASEVLRMLETNGKQSNIDHRTLVQTLLKVNSHR